MRRTQGSYQAACPVSSTCEVISGGRQGLAFECGRRHRPTGGAAFGRGHGSAEIGGDNGIAGSLELRFDQKN
jgi:hypothetical protein